MSAKILFCCKFGSASAAPMSSFLAATSCGLEHAAKHQRTPLIMSALFLGRSPTLLSVAPFRLGVLPFSCPSRRGSPSRSVCGSHSLAPCHRHGHAPAGVLHPASWSVLAAWVPSLERVPKPFGEWPQTPRLARLRLELSRSLTLSLSLSLYLSLSLSLSLSTGRREGGGHPSALGHAPAAGLGRAFGCPLARLYFQSCAWVLSASPMPLLPVSPHASVSLSLPASTQTRRARTLPRTGWTGRAFSLSRCLCLSVPSTCLFVSMRAEGTTTIRLCLTNVPWRPRFAEQRRAVGTAACTPSSSPVSPHSHSIHQSGAMTQSTIASKAQHCGQKLRARMC